MAKASLRLLLLATLIPGAVLAQVTVSGTVLDAEDRTTLIGVNVHLLNDETVGTSTSIDGTFSIEVPHDSVHLVFSYTGFRTSVLRASAVSDGPILLGTSFHAIEEVVVIGYGTQQKRDVTGSIASVNAEDVRNTPVVSLESALQGRAAGVHVSNESGKVGFNIDVIIRGISSINASQQPLYIVDGQVISTSESVLVNSPRLNPLATLNPNDIASVDILKDASAAAIYGARASNGVVLITTRDGSNQQTRIELDVNAGWSRPSIKREWLDAGQYLELLDEAFGNVADENGLVYGATPEQWKDRYLPGWRAGHDTDWEDLMYDPKAGQANVQLSLAGGNDKTDFFISGGYSDHNAIIILNDLKRYSGRINLNHSISSKLDFGVKVGLSRSELTEVPYDWDFASPGSLRSQSPVQPLYDPQNPGEIFDSTFYFHAWSYVGNVDWKKIDTRTLGNAYMEWRPHEKLTLHADAGLDVLTINHERWYSSEVARNTGEPKGLKRKWDSEVLNYSTNLYAQFDWDKTDHRIQVTAGMTFQESQQESSRIFGRNFPNDELRNLASAGEIFNVTEQGTGFSVLSYFGRINYGWNNRLLVTLSSRVDGDSRFGPDHRYGWFPAISAGWVLSEEDFIQRQDLLTYLKLRASWGITGNAPVQHFPSLGLYGGRRYGQDPGYVQTQIPNPDLKWEETSQVDIGLDFGILEDRVSGSFDIYVKNTSDLLLEVNLPAITGFSSQLQNLGKLKNRGFEVSLQSYNLTGKFKWQTQINWSRNVGEVTELQGQIIEHDLDGIINRVAEGYPFGAFFAPEFAGVDPANGDALYYLNTTGNDGELDRSTTNNIASAQAVFIGDPNPDFIYGITNNFQWKNLHLSILLQGVHGNQIYNAAARFQMNGFGWFDNQDLVMLDRWQEPGDITDIPQVRFGEVSFGSSRFVSSGSYLRVKNIRLAYQLPSRVAGVLGMEGLEFYFVGQNIATWTNYAFGEPEINTDVRYLSDRSAIGRGISFFTPPQARTLLFGMTATF